MTPVTKYTVAPLVGDFNGMITGNPAQTAHSVTGPIIVITCLVLILAVAGGMWWSRR